MTVPFSSTSQVYDPQPKKRNDEWREWELPYGYVTMETNMVWEWTSLMPSNPLSYGHCVSLNPQLEWLSIVHSGCLHGYKQFNLCYYYTVIILFWSFKWYENRIIIWLEKVKLSLHPNITKNNNCHITLVRHFTVYQVILKAKNKILSLNLDNCELSLSLSWNRLLYEFM